MNNEYKKELHNALIALKIRNFKCVYIASNSTVLMLSAGAGHNEIVKELLNRKADIEAKANDGVTALILAARNGHTETVRELIKRKANINASRTTDGATAHIVAAYNGHLDTVKELIDQKANIEAKSNVGATALMSAAA